MSIWRHRRENVCYDRYLIDNNLLNIMLLLLIIGGERWAEFLTGQRTGLLQQDYIKISVMNYELC